MLNAHEQRKLPTVRTRRIGPPPVFERSWKETGCQEVIEEREIPYIVGVRMKVWKEVRDEVLSRAGRYQEVHPPRATSKAPSVRL